MSALNEFEKKQFCRQLKDCPSAREDKSPVVRLYLASALQRLPVSDRWEILEALFAHSEDANDHNLPLMYWYAAEPLATVDAKRALQMAESTKLPNLLNFTVRRTAALGTPEAMRRRLLARLGRTPPARKINRDDKAARQLEILNGFRPRSKASVAPRCRKAGKNRTKF